MTTAVYSPAVYSPADIEVLIVNGLYYATEQSADRDALRRIILAMASQLEAARDGITAFNAQVDQTDPQCPIGTALTRAGLTRSPGLEPTYNQLRQQVNRLIKLLGSDGAIENPAAGQGMAIYPRWGHDSVAETIEITASHVLHGLPLSHEQHVEACAEIGGLTAGQLAVEHGCPVHAGAVHGGEAQELRLGIEAILELAYDDNHIKDDLQQLLNRVDAGDSLAHMERAKKAQGALDGSPDTSKNALKRCTDSGTKIDKPLDTVGDFCQAIERQLGMKAPLSAEGSLGTTWNGLNLFHHQQESELATARDAGHQVIHDSIPIGSVKDSTPGERPAPGEQCPTAPLHWALITHDLTCALSHLSSMAKSLPREMTASSLERPILDLAIAAVAFTVQLAIETEGSQDAIELRELERKLIASLRRVYT